MVIDLPNEEDIKLPEINVRRCNLNKLRRISRLLRDQANCISEDDLAEDPIYNIDNIDFEYIE